MRSAAYVLGASLALGVAGTASAQTAPTPSAATTQASNYGTTVSHWIASGFVGGGFDANGDSPNIDSNSGGVALGGQVGYLWRGIVGPEFLFEWAPNFNAFETSAIPDDANMTSYMANAIGAWPLGADGQIVPFADGGYGRIRTSADVVGIGGNTGNATNSDWGWNVGGGLMAFATPRFGVRGDIRWTKAKTDDNFDGTPAENLIRGLVSGLSYWRATGGVTFRW